MRSLSDMVPVYVGLDYHKDSIRVCVMTEAGDVLANRSVVNEVDAVRAVVDQQRGLVRGVAIEACGGALEFALRLESQAQWNVKLAHAGAVARLKQRADKTDHGDAWHLADLLRVKYLPEVWLPDRQTRQLRQLMRHRDNLAESRKETKLRIQALLREENVSNDTPHTAWTKAWMAWVKTVTVGEHSRWILDQKLDELEALEQRLKVTEDRMKQTTQDDPVMTALMELPGVALITAFALRAVVGRFDRFKTGKQLSRYCGVTPCNNSSGKKQQDAGLIDGGHDILRPILLELAKRLPRVDQATWGEFSKTLKKRKAANVVAAAVANRWLRKLYHMMVPKPQSS